MATDMYLYQQQQRIVYFMLCTVYWNSITGDNAVGRRTRDDAVGRRLGEGAVGGASRQCFTLCVTPMLHLITRRTFDSWPFHLLPWFGTAKIVPLG